MEVVSTQRYRSLPIKAEVLKHQQGVMSLYRINLVNDDGDKPEGDDVTELTGRYQELWMNVREFTSKDDAEKSAWIALNHIWEQSTTGGYDIYIVKELGDRGFLVESEANPGIIRSFWFGSGYTNLSSEFELLTGQKVCIHESTLGNPCKFCGDPSGARCCEFGRDL